MSDRKITCSDCNLEFTFSEKEQIFFKEKDFEDPRRCPKCRIRRRELNYGKTHSAPSGNKYQATCSCCGADTYVPFKPDPKRLIYCRNCLQKRPTHRKYKTPQEGIKV